MFTATTGTIALPPAAPAMASTVISPSDSAFTVRELNLLLFPVSFTTVVSSRSAVVVLLTTPTPIAVPTPVDFANSFWESSDPAFVAALLLLLAVIERSLPTLIAALLM